MTLVAIAGVRSCAGVHARVRALSFSPSFVCNRPIRISHVCSLF